MLRVTRHRKIGETDPVSSRVGPFRPLLRLSTLMMVIVVVGCATGKQLPPVAVNPDGEVRVGKFVWADLVTEKTDTATAFYQGLFDWRAEPSKEDASYFVFSKDGKPIGGMVATENLDKVAPESLWLLSLSVTDVDKAAALVQKHGGKMLEGPMNVRGRGRMALISDPAGAPLILMRAAGGDPVDVPADTGEWLWTDLFTRDAGRARDFYRSLVGYRAKRLDVNDGYSYKLLIHGHLARAGVVELDWDGLEDNWLPYFRVANVDKTVEKARRLGGILIIKEASVAILSDPTGAVFGIQMMQ